jgi:hypothetical protein
MLEYRLIDIQISSMRYARIYRYLNTRLAIPGYLQLFGYRTDGSDHGSLPSVLLYIGGILPNCNLPCLYELPFDTR